MVLPFPPFCGSWGRVGGLDLELSISNVHHGWCLVTTKSDGCHIHLPPHAHHHHSASGKDERHGIKIENAGEIRAGGGKGTGRTDTTGSTERLKSERIGNTGEGMQEIKKRKRGRGTREDRREDRGTMEAGGRGKQMIAGTAAGGPARASRRLALGMADGHLADSPTATF
ncbi:hypothetical protein An08g04950 [Aspergillus niger]|uniref:Uncharacterized protein n=2 Tax=Aspergillus niger TaxID=5061 RepID=A2QR67_ASPNC|nr:hypothetical protein An08g04950 [Aspergillus niger]CAK45468.1 hypothetical protein An08g04950 [Aspergillus niger]